MILLRAIGTALLISLISGLVLLAWLLAVFQAGDMFGLYGFLTIAVLPVPIGIFCSVYSRLSREHAAGPKEQR